MRVNGEEIMIEKEYTLMAFLMREGYPAERIAVEKNGKIIPKTLYDTEILDNGDRLEIVTFVGGG